MGLNVEARGKQQVQELAKFHFDNNECCYFSLWCGKELRFPFCKDIEEEAMNTLAQNLQLLEMSQTQAIYTLRFHTGLDNNKRITNNTPYSGSFNFKMFDNQGYAQGGMQPGFVSTPNQQVLEAVQALRAEVEELKAGGGIGDVNPHMELVNTILQIPGVGQLIGNIADRLVPPNPNRYMSNQNRGIAGVDMPPADDEQLSKVQQAVERLIVVDPMLGDHLLKLAELAEKKPGKYNMALNFL